MRFKKYDDYLYPNKKSIISLFNDQLKGFHRCYYYHFFHSLQFFLVCMASNQLTNIGTIYSRKNRLRLTELGCFLNKKRTFGINGSKKSLK